MEKNPQIPGIVYAVNQTEPSQKAEAQRGETEKK
jgi:hypothetical protein